MFLRLNLFFFISLVLLSGCPVYDPPNPGPAFIYNCSNEAIYVYHSQNGKLEMEPRLVLFEKKKSEFMFENTGCANLLKSPKYRINAYEEAEVTFPFGKDSQHRDSVIYYFITEQTMKESSWEEIVNQQLYERRISLSSEAYFDLFRVVTYTPKD